MEFSDTEIILSQQIMSSIMLHVGSYVRYVNICKQTQLEIYFFSF